MKVRKRERGGCCRSEEVKRIYIYICWKKNPNGILVNIGGAGQLISVPAPPRVSGQIF